MGGSKALLNDFRSNMCQKSLKRVGRQYTLLYVQVFILQMSLVLLANVKTEMNSETSWLTAEPCSWLGGGMYGWELDTTALLYILALFL